MICVFCQIIARKAPALVVYEDHLTIAFLDKYPQSRGHLQLVPKIHVRWIYDLPEAEIGRFFTTAAKITRGIIPVLGANHVSWGTFGQEIPHAHLWIVPQYAREIRVAEGVTRLRQPQSETAEILKRVLN
ncbi:MAG: hypothetical protein UV59_C0013G0041 [Candidatus Gottesmanbacteria bacterium GW2011_GWA1_43_11]|uniref:HIT domain-containing protein n=1 Tax=Candidatus Gottesmanbacteria bacterium GW2011_GWA1_43_11 TaxID=1618436 RepID=A0A0G1FDC3_9BACT|nr:MAG: hypothetical protein UV59_C0013G0041 [Candidatus Gottesmanbacteria bacterium GW2011_GWA1_43_11]